MNDRQDQPLPEIDGTGSIKQRLQRYGQLLAQGLKPAEAARRSGYTPPPIAKANPAASERPVETSSQPRQRVRPVNHRQADYIKARSAGMSPTEAARAAGYTEAYAKEAARRLDSHPLLRQEIEGIQAEVRTRAVYSLETAMGEAKDAMEFAHKQKNAMAYCKAVELRSKLSGLLIDRVHIEKVDVSGALREAEDRVQAIVIDVPALELPGPSVRLDDSDSSDPRGTA